VTRSGSGRPGKHLQRPH